MSGGVGATHFKSAKFFSSADAQCVLQSLQQAMYDAGQVIEKSRS
jgi:hypothetical protein